MQTFKAGEKTWTVELTFGVCKKIAALTKIDLVSHDWGVVMHELVTRPLSRLDMLYCMLTEDVDQEAFDNSISGPAFQAANKAFWDEIDFFIQSFDPAKAKLTQDMLKRHRELTERQAEMVIAIASSDETMQMIDQNMNKLQAEMQEEIGRLSIELPEPLESTRARSPSEN